MPVTSYPAPFWSTNDYETVLIWQGNSLKVMKELPSKSVHTVVTSPPYWGMRDYGNDKEEEIGSEKTPSEFVKRMVELFGEIRRVLRDDGTVWLNLGDTYGNQAGLDARVKPGNIVGIPWKTAFALQDDGWVLRQDIIWDKPCSMPESVTNRCTKSHEYIFLLAKNSKYYYDHDAVKEKAAGGNIFSKPTGAYPGRCDGNPNGVNVKATYSNRRSVWRISPANYTGAHFACVDNQTEALTRTGWKCQDALKDGEEILAFDKSLDRLIWQKATIYRYDYDGDLVAFDKRDTSQYLTPNHRCLVQSKKGIRKVKEAREISGGDKFLMTGEVEEKPEISIGIGMASLVGWYTSEGYRTTGKYPARITQSNTANPSNVQAIDRLLRKERALYLKRYRQRIYNGQEKEEVTFCIGGEVGMKLLSLCPNKEITDQMTRLPKEELRSLLSAFVAGDGNTRADGRATVIQKHKRRIEQIQVLALKLGYRAFLSQRKDGEYALYLTKGRWLSVRGTDGKWEGIQTKHYKGIVWCPNVPSGFWLARRNGKPFITGNTYPPKLIEPCILAGTSEKGCCPECGTGWTRVLVEVTGQKIKGESGMQRDRSLKPNRNGVDSTLDGEHIQRETVGWKPSCDCYGVKIQSLFPRDKEDPRYSYKVEKWWEWWNQLNPVYQELETTPAIVLDPFLGSGTTAQVATEHGRQCWGIELSKQYILCNAIPRIEGHLMSKPATVDLVKKTAQSVLE